MFKNYIQKKLEKYVRRYLAKHKPTLILVTGSVGKTTTKLAIATVLSEKYRVRVHEGNHNTTFSAPLAILGINYPDNIRSLGAWVKVRSAALQRIKNKTSDCDVIVQELGTDQPGDVPHFGTYIRANISVVTAISPEHMEAFKTLEAVAKEELSVIGFSDMTFINRDDIPAEFAHFVTSADISTYGLTSAAEYYFEINDASLSGANGTLFLADNQKASTNLKVASQSGIKAAVVAAAVAQKLTLNSQQIQAGIAKITPPAGRMNPLKGLNESLLIDDTYNSSPLASQAALQTLYNHQAPQRIAILGDMNELGDVSAQEHKKIGEFCNCGLLDWVVTIGSQSEKYLAPAARAHGCQVKSFSDPISAGSFVHSVLNRGAVVLAKGSQNGVFAEEALKILLHDNNDEAKLVRQTPYWLEQKHKQFDKF